MNDHPPLAIAPQKKKLWRCPPLWAPQVSGSVYTACKPGVLATLPDGFGHIYTVTASSGRPASPHRAACRCVKRQGV